MPRDPFLCARPSNQNSLLSGCPHAMPSKMEEVNEEITAAVEKYVTVQVYTAVLLGSEQNAVMPRAKVTAGMVTPTAFR